AAFVAGAGELALRIEQAILRVGKLLGALRAPLSEYRARTKSRRLSLRGLSEGAVQARVEARAMARLNKDFAESDRIRDELAALGVALRDSPEGTEWTIEQ
ncbi:MAG TPA: hypothetical protein VFQ35_21080, partial [Polyangiaceae bacterium]|nr:hypothetical protein [Polyangiaceae bacterium]